MSRSLSVAIATVAIVLLSLGAGLVSAEAGRTYLRDGEHLAVPINKTGDDHLWVRMSMLVIEGPPINVWVTDEEGYQQYLDDNRSSFDVYVNHSAGEVHSHETWFTLHENGTTYVVFDNDRNLAEGQWVRFEYSVSWSHPGDHSIDLFFLDLILTGMLVMMLGVFLFTGISGIRTFIGAKEAERNWVSDSEDEANDPGGLVERALRMALPERLDEGGATGWDPDTMG